MAAERPEMETMDQPEAVPNLSDHRTYLLQVANRELSRTIRGRVAPSDLVQEALLEAERLLNRGDRPVPSEVQPWLRRILLNQIAHAHRTHLGASKRAASRETAGLPLADHPSAQPSPSSYVSHGEQAERLRQHIARLPPDYRELLELRYTQGLAFADIAVRLGRTEVAVRSLWARAVGKLREDLGDGQAYA
jgi:RNA polymerase sigma-70 factor, ECF subfamily